MLNKLSVALSVLAFTPTLISAHGQLSWVKVAGKEYPAWNLDDHYKAAYKKQGESLQAWWLGCFEDEMAYSLGVGVCFDQILSTVNNLNKSTL